MYIDILCRWNVRINLTAIRDPEEIVTRHFGESLFAARHLFPDGRSAGERAIGEGPTAGGRSNRGGTGDGAADASATRGGAARKGAADGATADRGEREDGGSKDAGADRGRAALQGRVAGQEDARALAPVTIRVADIGSGAGFPGLPIKLWAPQLSLTMIESNHRKAAFLREVTRALTLTDVNIQNTRAESLGRRAAFDVVTVRAVERFEAILPTAAALVTPPGRLALLIGFAQQDQARRVLRDFVWSEPAPIPASRSRILLIARREATNQTG
jgi:16S rRNA (guanine(527)-N(7))-methyltransferase RsmG